MKHCPYQSVSLELKPSRLLLSLMVLFWSSLIITVNHINISIEVKLACALVITFLSIWHTIAVICLKAKNSPKRLDICLTDLTVTCNQGIISNVKLHKKSLLHPSITILVVKKPSNRFSQTIYLTKDNCQSDEFRRLRVILKLRSLQFLR